MQLPAGFGGVQLGPEDVERRLLDALDLPGQLASAGPVVVCYDEFQDPWGLDLDSEDERKSFIDGLQLTCVKASR